MMFDDALGAATEYNVSIHATDIDPDALEVAKAATYAAEKRTQIPERMRAKYTRDVDGKPEGRFEIVPGIRRLVRAEHYSLFDSSPMKLVDLILCRNVFIYFDRTEQSRVLDAFWTSMTPGAFLVLGRSERLSPDAASRFETIDSRERIYRKPVRS
jgi:chemotaxis methyl-accepting protein methylase